MSKSIKGAIKNFVPSFKGSVNQKGMLVIKEAGTLALTVDTGFSGAIALPEPVLDEMKIELADYGIFRLATGEEVELPVFWGTVAVREEKLETWFIPGDSLLGMEFLSLAGSLLVVDFRKQIVKLSK